MAYLRLLSAILIIAAVHVTVGEEEEEEEQHEPVGNALAAMKLNEALITIKMATASQAQCGGEEGDQEKIENAKRFYVKKCKGVLKGKGPELGDVIAALVCFGDAIGHTKNGKPIRSVKQLRKAIKSSDVFPFSDKIADELADGLIDGRCYKQLSKKSERSDKLAYINCAHKVFIKVCGWGFFNALD